MIFSALFKANWQHKKANVRLTAIADELTLTKQEHIDILTNLAKHDANDSVRKAALLKLANIALYIEILNANTADSDFAQRQIEEYLLAHNSEVDTNTKEQLIALLPKAYLEQWLIHENDIHIAKSLHQKINKPQHIVSGFNKSFTDDSMTESFQLFLLSNINDISLLEKLTKKTSIEPVKHYIHEQITELTRAKEKPIQLTKSIQLLLSKLLALKDSKLAYIELRAKRTELESEWQIAQQEFTYLSEEQVTTFTEKYNKINNQLDKSFAPLKEQYQQDKITKALQLEQATAKQHFDDVIGDLEQTLANAVFENNDLTGTKFETQLNELPTLMTTSVLNDTEQRAYIKKIETLQKKLQQLPEIAQSVTQATHLISKISQLAVPTNMDEMTERSVIFQTWLSEWKSVEKQSVGTLPDSIKSAKNEIVKQWKAGLAPFEQEQKALFNQVQKYITDIKRLIANGKFNPCFGLYKKLKKEFSLLSVNQQQKLQRGFEQVTEKINELSDWEQYIATPKKQELLTQIKALVEKPLDNLNEQANLVKQYRQQWNSLGHADDSLEKALNDEFNEYCEQAFVPCRAFYAEQDKLRQQHAIDRKNIIEQVNALAATLPEENTTDGQFYKALDAQLNKLNKAWREAGEVDKKQYTQLQKNYKNALAPIKQYTGEYHQRNIDLKLQLINEATQCYNSDNVFNAVNDIKKLQQKWRTIGYAGPKQDNTLWQSFRSVNDKVFKKRDTVKSEQDNAQSNIKSEFIQQIKELKQAINITDDLKESLKQAQQLLSHVIANKPVIKSVASDVESIIVDIEQQIQNDQAQHKKQQWLHIFSVLNELTSAINIDELQQQNNYLELPNTWQKKLTEAATQTANKNGDRLEKTLKLEILGRIESPTEFANERLAMQVSLLQEQMLSDEKVDLKALFIDWLLAGKFTESDNVLIERIKPLYC